MGRGTARMLAAFGLLAVGLLVAEIADWRMKHGPFRVPVEAGAGVSVYAADGPAVWRAAAASPPGAVAAQHFSPFLDDAALAVRKATGIRPTPGRWRLWLGKRVWLHWDGVRTIAAFRPGLLFRCYWLLARRGDEGTIGGWHVRWQDGMLLLVSDGEWSGSPLRVASVPSDQPPETVLLTCRISDGSIRYRIHLDVQGDWRFRGDVLPPDSEAAGPAVARPLAAAFPARPALSVAASDVSAARLMGRVFLDTLGCDMLAPTPANLARCLVAALPLAASEAPFLGVVESWEETLAHWRVAEWPVAAFGGGAARWAFYGVDLEEWYALPRWAAVLELPAEVAADTLGDWPEGLVAIPYAWYGISGYRVPLLSDGLELCVADGLGQRFVASNETLMEQLVAARPAFGGAEALLQMRLDWGALAANLQRHAIMLLDGGYFGDVDALAFNRRYGGVFTGLAALEGATLTLAPHPAGGERVLLEGGFFFADAGP